MHNTAERYVKPVISGIIVGIIVFAVMLFMADVQGVAGVFSGMRLGYLPLILALAPLNYFFRYIKWNYFLRLVDLKPEARMNKLIFISGLSMTVTPGKVGELLKCYLLKEYMDAPISVTSSVVMAERFTDAISVVILASMGMLSYRYGAYILLVTALLLVSTLFFSQIDALAVLFTRLPGRFKFLIQPAQFLYEFQRSAKKLLGFRSLLFAVAIGVLSWGFEGLVIYLTVRAFGGELSILAAVFTVSFSSILGALSVLPGGVGVAEGSIMTMLVLRGLSKESAAATTVVTRISTLWLGVAIGVAGLYLTRRELKKQSREE